LVDPNTRQGKRTPVTLKIKFKSETLEQFIERYAVDVSQGGIFIRTKEPLAVGTQMKFEFQLRDASPLIAGEGTVVWTRENDPSRPAIAPGMGVRFDRLADGSQGILERILTEKAKQAPQRPVTDTAKPPLFTDTPTRVAPAPIQDALLGNELPRAYLVKDGAQRRRGDDSGSDSHTPLPRPMPFHSDADEFPDEAFEEATKVRALDELIAQTAEGGSAAAAAAELAARRPAGRDAEAGNEHSKLAAQIVEPDDLPEPPEPVRPQPKLLDTSPSPRIEPAAINESGLKTRPGVEPARGRISTPPVGQPTLEAPPLLPSNARAVAAEQTEPSRLPAVQVRSKAPIFMLLLLLVAAGGAAVWFFVIRPRQLAEPEITTITDPGSAAVAPGSAGSAVAPGSAGSAGSAVAVGSAGSATPGSYTAPVEIVDTVIAASVDGATVEIAGTDQSGPAPLTAKLERGKPYKAKVSAKGFVAAELELKGGDDKQTAKLVAKPRVISVDSDPPGALIFVDSGATGHATPFDVELTAAQAAKKTVRVLIRKSGFKSVERVVDLAKLTEDDARLTAKVNEKLTVPPVVVPVHTGAGSGSSKGPGQGSDAGSAAGSGDGPVVTPGGDGTAGTAGGTAGSAAAGSAAEPEPEFNKRP
jgi:uncharacterized protein (TIGR02266 family)